MIKGRFSFELMCTDSVEIQNEKTLANGLSYSANLWSGNEPRVDNQKEIYILHDELRNLKVAVSPLEIAVMEEGLSGKAYILKVTSTNFEELDGFREILLNHLEDKLGFKSLRILRDDLSIFISNRLYLEINSVENLLRRYLVKFFTQRLGHNWWEMTATKGMKEKVQKRLAERADAFSNYTVSNIEELDFDDLGTIIFKQSAGFNEPEIILERLMAVQNLEELERIKGELRGNYSKYFKDSFNDRDFEHRWNELSKIREKVLLQSTFYKADLDYGSELVGELIGIISDADEKSGQVQLTDSDKAMIRNASLVAEGNAKKEEKNVQGDRRAHAQADNRVRIEGPKVMGRIKLPHSSTKASDTPVFPSRIVINEDQVITELKEAEELSYNQYVGLKWFVTSFLANKNYSIGYSYSKLNFMIDNGQLEIYDQISDNGYHIKAIRLPLSIEKEE